MIRTARLSATALLFLCATACASSRAPSIHLVVNVAPDVNADRPIPVDVVLVWNKKMAGDIGGLPAKDWFLKKGQLRREDPQEKAFAVHEWEWVPGQAVPAIEVTIPSQQWRHMRGVFLFANYPGDGPHRVRISPGSTAVLELLREDLRFQEAKGR